MKNFYHYLHNIIFWISRLFTILILGTCFFAVLNAKYVFSEKFFPAIINFSYKLSFFLIHNILNINDYFAVSYSLIIDGHYYSIKYLIYKSFCIHSQQIDILLILSFIIFILCLIVIINLKKNSHIYIIASFFIIYFVTYLITSSKEFLLLSVISTFIFIILRTINNCNFSKKLILFPFFGEFFCIIDTSKYIYKKISDKPINLCIVFAALVVSNIVFIFLPVQYAQPKQILSGSIYNIFMDEDKIIVSSLPPCIIDKNEKYFFNNTYNGYQDIIYNEQKKEIYVYDHTVGIFYILDVFNRAVKYKTKLEDVPLDIISARLCCNNDFSLLSLAFEGKSMEKSNLFYLFNLEDYKLLGTYPNYCSRDFVIYNKYRNSFLITYYQDTPLIREFNLNTKDFNDMNAGWYQGYSAISEINKEIYIAFHQQGTIAVYDAETMKLKRKIKSNYTVKDITYDEELNILIAPSYFTGYIDIFLMDGNDKLLTRKFVGYELRQAKFDTTKENLYVCSKKGLYKVPLDIKSLIKKNKNVSHETNN